MHMCLFPNVCSLSNVAMLPAHCWADDGCETRLVFSQRFFMNFRVTEKGQFLVVLQFTENLLQV